MSVTLNYTSKGLIDAIQKELAQQKNEGKISGDTSYKKITNCDFWSTIKTINDNHDKKNKVFHGKSYSCDDRGKNIDWRTNVVVYGSTTFTDEEWEMLVRSMGLELTSKTKETEELKADEELKEQEESAQVEDKEQPLFKYNVSLEAMDDLLTEVEKILKQSEIKKPDELKDEENNTKVTIDIVDTFLNDHSVERNENGDLIVKDKAGNTLSKEHWLEILRITSAKLKSCEPENAETNAETDDENCHDEIE